MKSNLSKGKEKSKLCLSLWKCSRNQKQSQVCNSLNSLEQKGRFSHSIKTGRKRKWHEIEEDKDDGRIVRLRKENEAKDEAVHNLKIKLQEFEQQREELLENQDKLARLYEMRIIDSKGDYIPYKPEDNDKMD